MKKIKKVADSSIEEVLEYYRIYPKPEIPLKEIENNLLKPLGFDKLVAKKGSVFTAHHSVLEESGHFAGTGNLTFHVIHGKKPFLISKRDFKKITYRVLKMLIDRTTEDQK